MDLRSFSEKNAGCVDEINELFNLVPLPRIVFVIDDRTDQEFMRETMKHAWRQIKDRSPNRRFSPARVCLVQLSRWNAVGIRTLLHAISVAASGLSPREPTSTSNAVGDPQEFSW
jgi:hypothetical protein